MTTTTNILITGANGQLGMEFRALSDYFPGFNFHFLSKEEISITDSSSVHGFIKENQINYFVNCAAYTAVDKAESEKEASLLINAEAPGLLASLCRQEKIKFIHFSTDYVFAGSNSRPYAEEDQTDPVNFYGFTKLKGELNILSNNPDSLIIRTSWVYSRYGKNFVKTMLRLMNEKEEIGVVNDQSGCPTYAADLAGIVLFMIKSGKVPSGILHYANRGVITWYDFAVAIKEIMNSKCIVKPIPTSAFPTPAKRPLYSALSTEKIRTLTGLDTPQWRDSLEKCLALLSSD